MLRPWKGKHPVLHRTAFVSEFAYVLGDVEIGENSSVWPGTVIRGDSGKITIGSNTNIQDNCVIHSDSDAQIGDNVTLGHGVVCHAKRIGNSCLIGNNATVNDPSEINDYCIIGANALVLDGMIVPSYSLVTGVPGKVKSSLNEKHLALIQQASTTYVEKSRDYIRAGLADVYPSE